MTTFDQQLAKTEASLNAIRLRAFSPGFSIVTRKFVLGDPANRMALRLAWARPQVPVTAEVQPRGVYRYRLATGITRWFFIIDLPTDADGRHRQHKRWGFPSHATAGQAEQHARDAYGPRRAWPIGPRSTRAAGHDESDWDVLAGDRPYSLCRPPGDEQAAAR